MLISYMFVPGAQPIMICTVWHSTMYRLVAVEQLLGGGGGGLRPRPEHNLNRLTRHPHQCHFISTLHSQLDAGFLAFVFETLQ